MSLRRPLRPLLCIEWLWRFARRTVTYRRQRCESKLLLTALRTRIQAPVDRPADVQHCISRPFAPDKK
ncbi:MAG TPA: hypothetical protein VGF67_28065 [Ktedonobacteraceae bacterium]